MEHIPKLAFSIDEFCRAYGLGKTTFFKLLKTGAAPRVMRVGHRTLISREAAEAWRRSVEQPAVDGNG